jgi:hypothetical protein
MNSENPFHNGLTVDDDFDAISTADFYFDDPTLHFPLSPISVRKEVFALTPFRGDHLSMSTTIKGVCLTLTNVKQTFRTNMDLPFAPMKQRTTLCPALSPRSEGTETTTDWMKDSCDSESNCGSLTYSVETDRFSEDYDEENALEVLDGATQKEYTHNCFRMLDGVIYAIQNIFRKQEQELCHNNEHMHGNYGRKRCTKCTQFEGLQDLR